MDDSYKNKPFFVRNVTGCKPTNHLTMGFRCKITQEQPVFSGTSLTVPILCVMKNKNLSSKVSLLAWMATKEARQYQQNRGNLTIL